MDLRLLLNQSQFSLPLLLKRFCKLFILDSCVERQIAHLLLFVRKEIDASLLNLTKDKKVGSPKHLNQASTKTNAHDYSLF